MNCCTCNGTCSHTGPHSFCFAHGGSVSYPVQRAVPVETVKPWSVGSLLTLADIERIADRVVEKLHGEDA